MNILVPIFSLGTLLAGVSTLPGLYSVQQVAEPDNADTNFRKHTNNAWALGEKTSYRVHYGVINAGVIDMEIEPALATVGKRNAYHIHAKGRSVSGFDWFFKVRDHYESYVDDQAIVPLQFVKKMEEGSYKDSDFAIFNYNTRKVSSARKGTASISKDVQDLLSAIYYSRTININNAKAGDVFPLSLYLDGEIYELQIKYIKKEVIKTDIGKVNAVKVVPLVIADRVFKEKEGLELWVSDDENKVPLRVKAELAVGSVKVDITRHSGLKHPLNMAK